MKICIRTYGCQMNVRDSEALGVLLKSHGHELVPDEDLADAVIVNTCSIRKKAEDKAIGTLRQIVSRPGPSGKRIVGAVGCMAQRMGTALVDSVEGLDFAIGTHRLASLPSVLDAVVAGEGPLVDVADGDTDFDRLAGHEKGEVSAFVTVLEGCNRGCSYCIVPTVRGGEVSRPAGAVVNEVTALSVAGVKEVTLIGQSVTSYGRIRDAFEGMPVSPGGFNEPFPRLLEAVSLVPGIKRIRFASSHPSGCTEELARAVAETGSLCEHLHLPVQSGSDRILGLMNRGYTAGEYLAAVRRFQAKIPGMSFTTDIIVGFPGETIEDFEMTRRLMDEAGFDNAFVFKYSPRPGTSASKGPDDVTGEEKARRNQVLLKDQEERGQEINSGLVGRRVEVLVEGVSPRKSDRWFGRTRTNKIVIFEKDRTTRAGDLVMVEVEKARPQTLHGRLVSEGKKTGGGEHE